MHKAVSCWSCRIEHSQPDAIHNVTGQSAIPLLPNIPQKVR